MENNYFSRSFDIDTMLHYDMVWLSAKADLPLKDFLAIGRQLDLRQEDWTEFWKRIRTLETKMDKVTCYIGTKEYKFTREEFEVAKQILNCPNPEEISNCCSASVHPHNDSDNTSRCIDCKEGCEITYLF